MRSTICGVVCAALACTSAQAQLPSSDNAYAQARRDAFVVVTHLGPPGVRGSARTPWVVVSFLPDGPAGSPPTEHFRVRRVTGLETAVRTEWTSSRDCPQAIGAFSDLKALSIPAPISPSPGRLDTSSLQGGSYRLWHRGFTEGWGGVNVEVNTFALSPLAAWFAGPLDGMAACWKANPG